MNPNLFFAYCACAVLFPCMNVVGQEKRIFTFAKKREIALLLPLLAKIVFHTVKSSEPILIKIFVLWNQMISACTYFVAF